MKLFQRLQQSFQGLTFALMRYPVTGIFLGAIALINGLSIQRFGFDQYDRLLATGIFGALITLVAQGIYERFFHGEGKRWGLAIGGLIITGFYYISMGNIWEIYLIISIRTAVLALALVVGFIWIPTIRSKLLFDQSLLIAFKAFFTSLFFGGVIMLGVSLIFGATDQLLFNLSYRVYPHAANMIFAIFVPMYFLSMIPQYHRDMEKEQKSKWSRFLEVLVAYIIIPLVSVFTVILVLYILLNIPGDFWTDNLLEPMLVTYSITVIFLYLLSGTLENKTANYFKKIFPKVLVPIVLFQTSASFLKIQEEGLTHGRYFVIVYGVFALFAGVLFSLYKGKKNGLVAMVLIILSIISIMPPMDAFSVSRRSQSNELERVLVDNGLLIDGDIQPVREISEEDRKVISATTSYLSEMNYTEDIPWFPQDFEYHRDFEEVFGFSPYESRPGVEIPRYRSFHRIQEEPIDISNFDYMMQVRFSSEDRGSDPGNGFESQEINIEGELFIMGWQDNEEGQGFYLNDKEGNQVLFISMEDVLLRLEEIEVESREIFQREAAFSTEDQRKTMGVILNFLDIYDQGEERGFTGEAYVLIGSKKD